MFNRLIGILGRAGSDNARHEIQLASAVLLAAVAPADFNALANEHNIATHQLSELFRLKPDAARRLYGRAVAARAADPAIFPAATILKRATDKTFRMRVLASCRSIAEADGSVHEFEQELLQRLEILLDIKDLPAQKSA